MTMKWKTKKVTMAAATLATIAVASWAYARFRTDSEVARVRSLAANLGGSGATPEQRKQHWQQFRTALEKLPKDKQKQVTESMRDGFRDRQREEMRRYFALSPKERTAYLDKQIRESEKRRKEWAAKAKSKTAQTANRPGTSAGTGTGAGNRPGTATGAGNRTGGANGGNGGGQGGRPPMTAEQRDQRRKQRLDDSSPEDRAQRAEFRRQSQQRRQQLGLPSGGGRRG